MHVRSFKYAMCQGCSSRHGHAHTLHTPGGALIKHHEVRRRRSIEGWSGSYKNVFAVLKLKLNFRVWNRPMLYLFY